MDLGIFQVHHNIWHIKYRNHDTYFIRFNYGEIKDETDMSSIVVTPMTFTDHLMTSREFKESVSIFLGQFTTIGSRWGGMFEMMTEKIIQEAANFQFEWLLRANFSPFDLLDESTLIAASLYCLTLANEIYQVTIS